ncbi:MAG: glycosyltransferase family 4 protein [Planctomycetaceae bacterium]|nr:glycosyltransferase family 4 protein [Planctomycetaceae bacterium]
MRVAHVITRLIVGGAQENTLLTVQGQHHDYQDEVTLITGPGLGPEGSLEGRADELGLDVRVIPELQRAIHPLRDWASYRALVGCLREYRPEIVHTHSSKAGILGRRAAYKLGIPCVHTIHGAAFHYGQSRLAYSAYVAAERIAARWTDQFISVSDDMTAEYLRAGIGGPDRYTTIYSGFDVEPFLHPTVTRDEVRQRLGLQPQDIVVGKIARLFHLKGHEFLLAAAPEIAAASPEVRFLLVGDGVLRESLQAEIRRLGLTDRFVFTGLVPPEQIPELIAAMDIVVHTSQWEGLARVLPQGLIAGKPVVSYDVGGAREVVMPGETGFLLPRDSVRDLALAVSQLAADPQLRDRLGVCGRERFTDQFRHQTMTRRIRDVYAAILQGRSS